MCSVLAEQRVKRSIRSAYPRAESAFRAALYDTIPTPPSTFRLKSSAGADLDSSMSSSMHSAASSGACRQASDSSLILEAVGNGADNGLRQL